MAKVKKERIYKVTVEGEFFKSEHDKSQLHPYHEEMRMNTEHKEAGFLWVWKNILAPQTMPRKYPGFTGLHTHRLLSVVDEAEPDTIPNDPTLMSLDQLIAFIKHNELPVDIGLYPDEDALKQAVIDCLSDEETFVEGQGRRKEVRGNAVELASSLAALNEGVQVGLESKATGVDKIKTDEIPDADDVVLPDTRHLSKPQSEDYELDVIKNREKAEANKSKKPAAKNGKKADKAEADDDEEEIDF